MALQQALLFCKHALHVFAIASFVGMLAGWPSDWKGARGAGELLMLATMCPIVVWLAAEHVHRDDGSWADVIAVVQLVLGTTLAWGGAPMVDAMGAYLLLTACMALVVWSEPIGSLPDHITITLRSSRITTATPGWMLKGAGILLGGAVFMAIVHGVAQGQGS